MSHEADELVLYADHDEPLYRQSFQPIIANLKKKIAKGTYSPTMAVKLWRYHADRAAQKYAKEFGGTWHKIFSTRDRQEAAEHWEQYARREYLGVTSHDRSRRKPAARRRVAARRPAHHRTRRDPGGPGKFIVKISSSRYAGEYSGGATLAEAVVEARRFKPRVGAGATIRVGYFTFGKSDPEDGRFHVSRTIQRGS